jgi:hypothetical protein
MVLRGGWVIEQKVSVVGRERIVIGDSATKHSFPDHPIFGPMDIIVDYVKHVTIRVSHNYKVYEERPANHLPTGVHGAEPGEKYEGEAKFAGESCEKYSQSNARGASESCYAKEIFAPGTSGRGIMLWDKELQPGNEYRIMRVTLTTKKVTQMDVPADEFLVPSGYKRVSQLPEFHRHWRMVP